LKQVDIITSSIVKESSVEHVSYV